MIAVPLQCVPQASFRPRGSHSTLHRLDQTAAAPSIFWSRAKDQWGMVESWQLTGVNDVTLGTESGEYQGTNKSIEGVKHLSLVDDYDLFTTFNLLKTLQKMTNKSPSSPQHKFLAFYKIWITFFKHLNLSFACDGIIYKKTINMTQQQLMISLKYQSKQFL